MNIELCRATYYTSQDYKQESSKGSEFYTGHVHLFISPVIPFTTPKHLFLKSLAIYSS